MMMVYVLIFVTRDLSKKLSHHQSAFMSRVEDFYGTWDHGQENKKKKRCFLNTAAAWNEEGDYIMVLTANKKSDM